MTRPLFGFAATVMAWAIGLTAAVALAADPPKEASSAEAPKATVVHQASEDHKASADSKSPGAHDAHGHAESHGHDDSHGHADPHGTDPISLDADLAFFSLVVFIVLLAVLKKFAWGPILSGLEKRELHIANEIRAAEEANADAKRLLADYEARLGRAQDEVRAVLDEARRDADQLKADIVEKAKQEAATEMARAKREVETARDQARQELLELGANLAVDLAGKIVQAKLSPADHQHLISEALGKFSSSTPSRN